jgi:hypothetical protein
MARGRDVVIRSGQVTIEEGGKVYTARYDVLKAALCDWRPARRPTFEGCRRSRSPGYCSGSLP